MLEWSRRVQWVSVAVGCAVGLALGWTGNGWAQKEAEPKSSEAQTMLPAKTLDEIYRKLDEVKKQAKRYGSRATEILEKVDQVLKNQEEMKKELAIVKIRASR